MGTLDVPTLVLGTILNTSQRLFASYESSGFHGKSAALLINRARDHLA
jgi:hypothetical protein